MKLEKQKEILETELKLKTIIINKQKIDTEKMMAELKSCKTVLNTPILYNRLNKSHNRTLTFDTIQKEMVAYGNDHSLNMMKASWNTDLSEVKSHNSRSNTPYNRKKRVKLRMHSQHALIRPKRTLITSHKNWRYNQL